MIFTEKLVDEMKILDEMEDEIFEKAINYCISIYGTEELPQLKFNGFYILISFEKFKEILELDENSTKLYDAFSKTILLLCKDKYNSRDYKTNLEMLRLSSEKKDIIHKKLEKAHDLLRKSLSNLESNPNLKFHDLEWRYDLQIASRSCKDETKPRIFLNLKLSKSGKIENLLLETDYANLKNLQEELGNALKSHESNKQKKLRKIFF